MKRIFLFLWLCIIVSCDTMSSEQLAIPGNVVVSVSEIKLPPVGGTYEFYITTNERWSIDNEEWNETDNKTGWIQITPNKGAAGTTKIKLTAGKALEDLFDEILFRSIEDKNKITSVKIRQEKPYLTVELEDSNDYTVSDEDWDPNWGGK